MLVKFLKKVPRWLRYKSIQIDDLAKHHCAHPTLTFMADAWDYEYICSVCDKQWFNKVPHLRRTVEYNGSLWRLTGDGNVYKVVSTAETN